MKVFASNKFTGHYPVGTAAVVVSETPESAAALLNATLQKGGLPGDAEPSEMIPISNNDPQVIILNDGNY